jgi:predicted GNAT family N-acyltransferase
VDPGTQDLIAFARVITDHVFKAFLFDVIVHPGHRGKGIGNFLLQGIVEHPALIGVRHIELYCQAERVEFYGRHGFSAVLDNLLLMRRSREA